LAAAADPEPWVERAAEVLARTPPLAGFEVVRLATPALFARAHPLQSHVLLADAALTLPDLFRLRFNATLVTLSACQTALSALEPGDELLGLREALLFAGARSLLVSLWAVDDASTGKLMALFYERLLHGLAPTAALASAQRQMRAEGESAFHWAPFVVIG
jgi:CHAT domain-containing protein